jgi:hypothetical protein
MSAFTARINDDVKLVGSTISCEGSPLHGKRHGRWRRNPHVQSYAVATDQVGWQQLCAYGQLRRCMVGLELRESLTGATSLTSPTAMLSHGQLSMYGTHGCVCFLYQPLSPGCTC